MSVCLSVCMYVCMYVCVCVYVSMNTTTYVLLYVCMCVYVYLTLPLWTACSRRSVVSKVFANDPGILSSIPGRVIPKTLKMVLDTSLINTHQYKVRIKVKEEQPRERSSALPNNSVQQMLKMEPSGRPRLRSATLLTYSPRRIFVCVEII